MKQDYIEERIEVRSYFREGGKVVGTERCSSEQEALAFAKHQHNYYPYVEIVSLVVIVHPFADELKSSNLIATFK